MQLNHINCKSTDRKSDTEKTISINIFSHIYQNHDQFLLNYYTRPIASNKTIEKIVEKITEEKLTECSSTNNIHQNIPKEPQLQKEKIWTIPLLLERPKCKQFHTPDHEIDFSIDSGAESNIINIPTWSEIKNLHPKLIPFKTTSRLATAQGSTLTDYGKNQFSFVPTRTMEQTKPMSKPFKQTFHITDIKHNIIRIPFNTKYTPTINILNSRIHTKDKYTRMKNTALTFYQRLNKQPPFSLNFNQYTIRNANT